MKTSHAQYSSLIRHELIRAAPHGLTISQLVERLYGQIPPENAVRRYRRRIVRRCHIQVLRTLDEEMRLGTRNLIRESLHNMANVVSNGNRRDAQYFHIFTSPRSTTRTLLHVIDILHTGTVEQIYLLMRPFITNEIAQRYARSRKTTFGRGRTRYISELLTSCVSRNKTVERCTDSHGRTTYRLTPRGYALIEGEWNVFRNDTANVSTAHSQRR